MYFEEKRNSVEYEHFAAYSYFTIQLPKKLFSGIWTDMAIEEKYEKLLRNEEKTWVI